MNYKEALNILDETVIGNLELKIVLSKSLEKQIPKKPIRANRIIKKDGKLFLKDDNEYWKCPVCTKYDVPLLNNQEYCHCCGKRIGWLESEIAP